MRGAGVREREGVRRGESAHEAAAATTLQTSAGPGVDELVPAEIRGEAKEMKGREGRGLSILILTAACVTGGVGQLVASWFRMGVCGLGRDKGCGVEEGGGNRERSASWGETSVSGEFVKVLRMAWVMPTPPLLLCGIVSMLQEVVVVSTCAWSSSRAR